MAQIYCVQVGCCKKLVRQCLADMKWEYDDAVVEQINRQVRLFKIGTGLNTVMRSLPLFATPSLVQNAIFEESFDG